MRGVLAVAAAALALAAAGCGGGGNELSRAEYTQSAESVCTGLDKQGAALSAPSTLREVAPFARKSAALLRDALRQLRALEVPRELGDAHTRWVGALEQTRTKLEALARAAQAGDEQTAMRIAGELTQARSRAAEAARELGLRACRNTQGDAGDPARVAAVMEAAGCEVRTVAAAEPVHITSRNEVVTYRTYPPTSGGHHPVPAIWGKYTEAVDPRQAVHNLEHGGIVIWFGSQISAADLSKLGAFYDESPNAMLVTAIDERSRVARYPTHEPLTTQIALTAWTAPAGSTNASAPRRGQGVSAVCPRFDRAAFVAFRDEFRGKGPERFPVDRLTPGS